MLLAILHRFALAPPQWQPDGGVGTDLQKQQAFFPCGQGPSERWNAFGALRGVGNARALALQDLALGIG